MKKIALLLVFVMIFGCCFALSSCGNDSNDDSSVDDSSVKSPKEEAQDTVKYQMMAEMNFKSLGGSSVTFISCTYGTTKDLGNNQYKVSGTVKVRDQYGNFHVANYDADVEYDVDLDDWDAEIEYGTFKKQ
jgi:hypothetical protein